MKRSICILLFLSILFSMTGCRREQEKIQVPVNFYYPRQEATFGSADSLISPMVAEGADYADDFMGLLTAYLLGPKDDNWRSPFPAGTQILGFEENNGFIRLTMSRNFANLTGMDLTLACACLTLTVLDLTGGNSVRISVPGATLNGAEYIRMDRNCLNLLDIINNDSQ